MRSSHISNSSENVVHVQIKIMCFFFSPSKYLFLKPRISWSKSGAMFNWFAFILLSLAPQGRFLIALIILNFNDLPSARVEIFLSHYSAGEERAHLCIIQRQGEILSRRQDESIRRVALAAPLRSLNAHTLAAESSFFANCRRL
jgi:hypothetical protein